MIVYLLAAVALLVPPPSIPQPLALKEIGRVRTTAFCTTLRENIAPTLAGLIVNDAVLEKGPTTFAKMGRDAVIDRSAVSLRMDEVRLEVIIDAMVRNFSTIDKLTGDRGRFSSAPKTDDQRSLELMRTQLVAVSDGQRVALNLMGNVLDAEQRGDLMNEGSGKLAQMLGGSNPMTFGGAAKSSPLRPQSFGAAHLADSGLPAAPGDPVDYAAIGVPTLLGSSPYKTIVGAIVDDQRAIAASERAASAGVLAAVAQCKGATR
ncbi:MAG: hypothetical protein M3Y21_04950 [Candidatus Eremiobacteraeota bacterium]|nr:hypothetical protein [Candidatus Eremiobacteraeota bacterium]